MKGFLLGFKVSGLGIRVRCLCLGFGVYDESGTIRNFHQVYEGH